MLKLITNPTNITEQQYQLCFPLFWFAFSDSIIFALFFVSSNKKNVLRSVFGPEFGCSCEKMKLPEVIQSQPIHPQVPPQTTANLISTSYALTKDSMSATFSLNIDTSPPCSDSEHDPTATEVEVTPRLGSQSSSAIGGSIAAVKESDDPYRDSLLQMILEKGIYSRDGLADLLRCFLELNPPCYHKVIIRSFSEIWHGMNHSKITGLGGSWR